MKKILLIRSNPVNPDPPVEKIANTLLGLGYSVTILGWDRSTNGKEERISLKYPNGQLNKINLKVKASFGGGIKKNAIPLLLYFNALKKWLKRNIRDFDIIHSFDFDTAAMSYRLSNKYKKKFIYHILDYYADAHEFGSHRIKKIIMDKENSIINSADATIICSDKRKEQIFGSNPKKLVIIHNTPDHNIVDPNLKVMEAPVSDKMKIIYVGILAGSRMLKEIAEIVSISDEYELHVGGFGPLEDFFLKMSSQFSNIYYYGKLPYDKTLALEHEGDVLVAMYDPTIRNNKYSAPNKFYESLMIGKPIIMAKNTGFDEIINNYSIGSVTEYSKEGIVYSLKEINNRRNEWDNISKVSKKLYKEQFSWCLMESRINDLYSHLSD